MERRPGLDANGVPYNLERTYARYGSEGETWMRERTGVTEAPLTKSIRRTSREGWAR